MKKLLLLLVISLISLHSVYSTNTNSLLNIDKPLKKYYGFIINDILCGYVIMDISPMSAPKRDDIKINQKIFIMSTALGMNINTRINSKIIVNKNTDRISLFEMLIDQGKSNIKMRTEIKNDTAYFTSSLIPEPIKTYLSDDVITDNPYYSSFVMVDFIKGNINKKTYKMYDLQTGKLVDFDFKRLGKETLELQGKKYSTVILEQFNTQNLVKYKVWYDEKTGENIKTIIADTREIFLADKAIIKKIKVADLNKSLFIQTNKSIADISNLIYLKVKAKLAPYGMKLTAEELNTANQKFSGTVEDNVINGIFEINLRKYKGENAPTFPYDFSLEVDNKYLEPSDRIESDDTTLIRSAEFITKDASDTWEAVKLLAKWVADSIDYVIPGGISALDTYNRRIGECGAHSLLLAGFCRTVGIPARVVWGCMYVPNYGGIFGQHGWTEVYLGKDAGWIQIDATANEIDYADAGHIRIGQLDAISISTNPEEMEIMDYKINKTNNSGDLIKKHFEKIGDYFNPGKGTTISVIILDGSLTLDIPNRIKLALNEANDKERYYAKLTNRLFVTFQTDKDKLKVVSFEIHELVNARKTSDSVTVRNDIPDEYETYLGKYIIPQLGKSFTVKYKNANLIIRDDAKNIDTRLQPPDKNGWRFDEYNKNSVKFYFNDNGKVNYYTLDVITKFTKGQLATSLIEKIAETDGIKTAIKQLFKLNEEKSNNYTINETSINLLGYKYLKQGKHKEAIAVLKVNTELYPESANTYDSLAEAYMKTGDSDKAIINYNKSLELNPDNENAKKMLLKLKTGK